MIPTKNKQKVSGIKLLFLLLIVFTSCKNNKSTNDFVSIFDGETLSGWEYDSTYWYVEDGNLVGEVTPETLLKRNTFIVWNEETPENFELKLEYRISSKGNSGINYRSSKVEDVPYALRGYQFDIDGRNRYSGQNYEERARTTLAYRGQSVVIEQLADSLKDRSISDFVKNNAWTNIAEVTPIGDIDDLASNIKSDDWNSCHLIVSGNKMQHYINGVLMSEVVDNDLQNRTTDGFIGVQVHVGPPMKVEFRNIMIRIDD